MQDRKLSRDAYATAVLLHRSGRLADADQAYREALSLEPLDAQALHLLGLVEKDSGRAADAVATIRRAIAISPGMAEMHLSLGNTLRELGQHHDAILALETAISLRPDFAEAHNNLGNALADLGRQEAANACFRRAIHLHPDLPEAHNNLGIGLMLQGRLELAEACFRRSLALRPDDAKALNNLGSLFVECQRLETALDCYRRALRINPDYIEAEVNLGMTLLATGDLAAGLAAFERRWDAPPLSLGRRHFPQPQWYGEARPGQTLLIHAEQGHGDTIQFCRYAILAAARGLRVIFELHPPTIRLLRSMPVVDQVIAVGDPLPGFDVHCPMMSLPLALGTEIATIPAYPAYLAADPAAAAVWGARLDAVSRSGPRVGLVWAGNPRRDMPAANAVDRRRSIAPELLAPFFRVPGVHFVSLQKDGPAAPAVLPLTDFMTEMTDFADTAALIVNLDLVISVDSAVAHLAGALGKPVWMLNRFDSCWRWLTGRRDTPWYPRMRIYRQPAPRNWEPVVAHVAHDLGQVGKAVLL